MESEKEALLVGGADSAPVSPTLFTTTVTSAPSSLPLLSTSGPGFAHSTPLSVPVIEVHAGSPTPENPTPTRHRLEGDRLEGRNTGGGGGGGGLVHSSSRHSLSRAFSSQQLRRKEARRQRSAHLPATGEVQHMEQSLLRLLNEFNSGELRAFDSAYSLEQMESVRDQQEALARKHFELRAEQDLHPLLSDEGLAMATENMDQLISSLEKLSHAIGNLSCLDRMMDPGARGVPESPQRSPEESGVVD